MKKISATCIGYLVTAIWILIWIFMVFYFDKTDMRLNEWGDFLAGTFAPLAFLWLILGYRQQGEELKQNTKALEYQVEELRHSVEQQKALAKATQDQLELEKQKMELALTEQKNEGLKRKKDIKPDIELTKCQPATSVGELKIIDLEIKNRHATAKEILIRYSQKENIENQNFRSFTCNTLVANESFSETIRFFPSIPNLLEIIISFKDVDQNSYEKQITLKLNRPNKYVIVSESESEKTIN